MTCKISAEEKGSNYYAHFYDAISFLMEGEETLQLFGL